MRNPLRKGNLGKRHPERIRAIPACVQLSTSSRREEMSEDGDDEVHAETTEEEKATEEGHSQIPK